MIKKLQQTSFKSLFFLRKIFFPELNINFFKAINFLLGGYFGCNRIFFELNLHTRGVEQLN